MAKEYTRDDFMKEYAHAKIDPKEEAQAEFFSLGSIKVDYRLRGGLKRGRISEWWGPNRSGKSTLALSATAGVLRKGGVVHFYDMERGLDIGNPDDYTSLTNEEQKEESKLSIENWLAVNGVDPFNENFAIWQPDSGEEMYKMIYTAIRHGVADLIVLDSVAAVRPEKELQGEIGDANWGAAAKLNSEGLRALNSAFKYQPANTRPHVFLINQARARMNSPVGGTTSGGGYALTHYATTRVKVQRITSKEKDGEVYTTARVMIEKCRHAPQGQTEIVISSKRGIDVMDEILDYTLAVGYVHKSGSWYLFYENPVPADEWRKAKKDGKEDEIDGFLERVQGKVAAKDWIEMREWDLRLHDEAVTNWAQVVGT